MKSLIVLFVTLLSTPAWADGFICTTAARDLKVSVFNRTLPAEGTRNASIMVVSDPTVAPGLRTISKFSTKSGTLKTAHSANDHLTFIGEVDLRHRESGDGGEYILGTRLAEVDKIVLKVDFVYGDNLDHLEKTGGLVKIIKRTGEKIDRFAACVRYLKNPRGQSW